MKQVHFKLELVSRGAEAQTHLQSLKGATVAIRKKESEGEGGWRGEVTEVSESLTIRTLHGKTLGFPLEEIASLEIL